MIKKFLLISLCIISLTGTAQSDFSNIDEYSKHIPDSLTTYPEIADYLTQNLSTDIEKARAIYIWISHNIRYDINQINSNRRASSQKIIEEVLTERQGVCQHYSELFFVMSSFVGLKSFLIKGYTRDATGKIADASHAWNAILVDSNYFLIDVTWAAGYLLNGKYVHKFRDNYFMIQPNDFIKSHIPFDPIWQFLDNPINHSEFIAKDFSKLTTSGVFNYQDSIQKYEDLNKLTKFEESNKRIIRYGIENNHIQKQIDENILQIANTKYNMAVDTLNYGIDNYNLYVLYKNKQFRNPKLQDSQIKELIDNTGNGIYTAKRIYVFKLLLTAINITVF